MTDTGTTLAITGLGKTIAGREIIRDCTLSVSAGEVCAVIGPNWAGKTTLFKTLAGISFPTVGRIELLGEPFTAAHRDRLLGSIGSVIEAPEYRRGASASDVLQLHLDMLGTTAHDPIPEILARAGLNGAEDSPVASFSLGMKQRLALARATSHRPRLLILDEPANGLDPGGIADLRQRLIELADDGVAVLIASHILSELEHTADTVATLTQGRLSPKHRMGEVVAENSDGLEGLYRDHTRDHPGGQPR